MPDELSTDLVPNILDKSLAFLNYGFFGVVSLSIVLVFVLYLLYLQSPAKQIPKMLIILTVFTFVSITGLGIVTFIEKKTDLVIYFQPDPLRIDDDRHSMYVRYNDNDHYIEAGKARVELISGNNEMTIDINAIEKCFNEMEQRIGETESRLDSVEKDLRDSNSRYSTLWEIYKIEKGISGGGV